MGRVFQGQQQFLAGDAGATPIASNVRARLNSDGFLDVVQDYDEDEEEKLSSDSEPV